MHGLTRVVVVVIVVGAMLAVASVARAQTYYPSRGSFSYNGYRSAQSNLTWDNPGGWLTSDPGYEHDFAIRGSYFKSCTTWTNLPSGYNDCWTAGVAEPTVLLSFSFGTYHAKRIMRGVQYFGSWSFTSGSSSGNDFYLNGQEVFHEFCPLDNIWCMGGKRSQQLLSGRLNRTVPQTMLWGGVSR